MQHLLQTCLKCSGIWCTTNPSGMANMAREAYHEKQVLGDPTCILASFLFQGVYLQRKKTLSDIRAQHLIAGGASGTDVYQQDKI